MFKHYDKTRDWIQICLPCNAEYIQTARNAAVEFARKFNLDAADIMAIEVAISEAVSNAVRHAYNGSDHALPIRVLCECCEGTLRFEIADAGCGFAAPADDVIPEPDLSKEGGLGIILIKKLMDSVSYSSRPNMGTMVTMLKRAPGCRSGAQSAAFTTAGRTRSARTTARGAGFCAARRGSLE